MPKDAAREMLLGELRGFASGISLAELTQEYRGQSPMADE